MSKASEMGFELLMKSENADLLVSGVDSYVTMMMNYECALICITA